jgi:four helix bundle protein
VAALPNDRFGDVLGRQLLRSGTSVGANYREALRASSRKQFLYCVEIALREADESLYWMDLIAESETIKPAKLTLLQCECSELVAILAATVRTSKQNNNRKA